jgi:hypothetical protein
VQPCGSPKGLTLTSQRTPIVYVYSRSFVGELFITYPLSVLSVWAPSAEAISAYSRTYARAVAGTPTKMHFDATTARFELCYAVDPAVTAPTEIYVSIVCCFAHIVCLAL